VGKLPVLKPREVATRLESLGFAEVRQRGSHKQYRLLMAGEQRFRSTPVETFPQHCCVRSRKTSVSRSNNFWAEPKVRHGDGTHAQDALSPAAVEHSGLRYRPTVGLVTEQTDASVQKRRCCQQNRKLSKGSAMSDAPDQRLLEALLDSWDRNNTILLNLLRALPEGGLEARAMEGSPSIADLFAHIHYVRLVFVFEDAPEFARNLPEEEWVVERDPGPIAQMLNDSAKAVRDAVKSRVEAGRDMNLHYDHPILLLQHMLWHEGYHHGQMKLALKVAGRPMTDEEAGPVTWDVWMRKK